MQVVSERPPVADKIKEVFGLEYDDGHIIVTYGENIHVKGGYITNELFAHEVTHIMQQKEEGPIRWWLRYFVDKDFRLKQELEAYQNQYRYILDQMKDKNVRYKHLLFMAKCLSGQMYGNMMTPEEAVKLIKNI